jgi:hypothetical protein
MPACLLVRSDIRIPTRESEEPRHVTQGPTNTLLELLSRIPETKYHEEEICVDCIGGFNGKVTPRNTKFGMKPSKNHLDSAKKKQTIIGHSLHSKTKSMTRDER